MSGLLDGRAATRDEALIALNDHLGEHVEVLVHAEVEDGTALVMTAKGPLHHWREDQRRAVAWANLTREDVAGLYRVGDAAGTSFDVTDLTSAWLLADDDEEVPFGAAFRLVGGVVLTVVWGASE